MFDISFKDQDDLLNDSSKLKHIHSIYTQGTPPDHDDDRQYFFSKYSVIKAIFENEERLVVQWLIDTADEYKKIGDLYIEKDDKIRAQACFAQGVALFMIAMNTFLLVLLDPNDEYKQVNRSYDAQLFSRFTDKNRYVLHVLSRIADGRLSHFFIPNAENNLLSTYLCQAAIAHLVERAQRLQHEPDEYDIALQVAAEFANTLASDCEKC